MDPVVLVLLACSALLHATWNILLKSAGDPLRTATIGMASASALLVPGALLAWSLQGAQPVPSTAIALGVASGLVEVAYFLFLAAAYERGNLSLVAPLARGSAPLLIVVVGVLVLGERLAVEAWVGVALLLVGMLVVQRPWRLLAGAHAADRGAAGFALATGVTIAAYSSIDRTGVQLMPSWLYAAILWPVCAAGLLVVDLARRRRERAGRIKPPPEINLGRSLAGGLFTLAAYLLLLAALSRAELVIVGPLRESAMLLSSLWGIVRLGESVSRRDAAIRIGGSALVLGGILTLAIAG